jgi:flagellar basal-body rod protein FlgC
MSLFTAISISASGMDAQRSRAEIITENLANADTTRTPDGGPYRRKDTVFSSSPVEYSFADALSAASGQSGWGHGSGVAVSEITIDDRDPERRYLPGHPDADKEGYVAFPRINPAEEMVDLLSASRGYQANVAAISAVKDMIARSIDLFR